MIKWDCCCYFLDPPSPPSPRPLPPLPSAPRLLSPLLVSSRVVRLGWKAPAQQEGVHTYAVFYSQEGVPRSVPSAEERPGASPPQQRRLPLLGLRGCGWLYVHPMV